VSAAATPRRRLGVLGWPVAHSRSPQMQEAGLGELGLADWRYQRLPVPPELFEETVRALPRAGFAGANVTIPHKEAALALADVATARARAIGAANTLTFETDGTIEAENTDAPGLIAALPFAAQGTRAVVLGAGGSARAIIWALVDAGAAEVAVWNRTHERAAALCAEFGGTPVRALPDGADVLVNCTAVGLHDPTETFDLLPLEPATLCNFRCVVDLVYGGTDTMLVETARRAGAQVVDGIDILVRQGAFSLERWTGRLPSIATMEVAARR
jgi:shikimate dehydrogenase